MKALMVEVVRKEVYTFIDLKTGANTHIDSGALRCWCAENRSALKIEWMPVEKEIAQSFLEVDKSVNLEHLAKVAALPALDPIIVCKTGTFDKGNGAPDVMLVDGHHRYFLVAIGGGEIIPCFILDRAQWEPFRVALPDMTTEQLIAMPAKGGLGANDER